MKQPPPEESSSGSEPRNLSRQNSPALHPQRESLSRTSRSIRLGAVLYFAAHNHLEDEQREWIARFQSRLNLDEVRKAVQFMHQLTTNPRIRARFEGEYHIRVPFAGPRPKRPEQRRIGVGYRDKGSLRESHSPVLPGEITLGEEASLFLGFTPAWVERGERLSQTEVMSDWRNYHLGHTSNLFRYSDEQWEIQVRKDAEKHLRKMNLPPLSP